MKFVIMAGGLGSKLWPYSRVKAPKQFIKLIGDKTLFQIHVDYLLQRYSVDDVFVSITKDLVHFVEEQAPQILKENYIIEPMYRDTGPAACLAMAKVASRYPDEVIYYYVQAVCARDPAEGYLDMIAEMEKLVKAEGKLVTGTIIPKYLETGSDLMSLQLKDGVGDGMKVYDIRDFINVVKERMTLEQVTEIANKSTVGTHTNHYTWRPKEFFEAINRIRPDWFGVIEELQSAFGKENESELVEQIYAKFEPNRFEVITTELIKEGKVMAIELPYNWAHITTWDDVYRYRDARGLPTKEGEAIEIESEGNLVLGQPGKIISLIGMKEMVVIDTPDALYIAPRSMSGRIKEVTDALGQKEEFNKFQ